MPLIQMFPRVCIYSYVCKVLCKYIIINICSTQKHCHIQWYIITEHMSIVYNTINAHVNDHISCRAYLAKVCDTLHPSIANNNVQSYHPLIIESDLNTSSKICHFAGIVIKPALDEALRCARNLYPEWEECCTRL